MTNTEIMAIIDDCAEASRLCWEMAADTADTTEAAVAYFEQAEACDDFYEEAHAYVACGNFQAARRALRHAAYLERQGGDDSHAQTALGALPCQ